MRSDDTEATKSSWLPLTGPEGVAGPPVCAEASPPGAGGSSCGGFFEQAARATMAVALSKGRKSFIGLLFNTGSKVVTQSGRFGSDMIHYRLCGHLAQGGAKLALGNASCMA